eukprot:TRINITY_DN24699_c0_g1_i1.p1 TRINITY_DN24699_c0_g1~~TRINITY_DN24699_c0_g1_i1.p1  ORF type:complete len:864 (+),score=255.73 TRINITY_DN24699_c0_g1_i1:51-2642(+)
MEGPMVRLLGGTPAKVVAVSVAVLLVFSFTSPAATPGQGGADEVTVRRSSVEQGFGFTFSNSLRVEDVTPAGPADLAGVAQFLFRKISHVGGYPVSNVGEVHAALKGRRSVTLRFSTKLAPIVMDDGSGSEEGSGEVTPDDQPMPERLTVDFGGGTTLQLRLSQRRIRKQPVWESVSGEPYRQLFSSAGGNWMLGEEDDHDSASKNRGEVKSAGRHHGKWPQTVTEWQRLSGPKGKKRWREEEGFSLAVPKKAAPKPPAADAPPLGRLRMGDELEDGDETGSGSESDSYDARGASVEGAVHAAPDVVPKVLGLRTSSGIVSLVVSPQLHNRHPVWRAEDGTTLFANNGGYWMIGKQGSPELNRGDIRSQKKHRGVMPQSAGAWCTLEGKRGRKQWRADSSVGVGALELPAGSTATAKQLEEYASEPQTPAGQVPRVIILRTPAFATVLMYDGQEHNKRPTWADQAGRRLFCSNKGFWMLTRAGDAEEGPKRNRGELKSSSPLSDKMPHEESGWEALQGELGRRDWVSTVVTIDARGSVQVQSHSIDEASTGEKGTVLRVLDVRHSGATSIECTFGGAFGELSARSPVDTSAVQSQKISVVHASSFNELKALSDPKVRAVPVVVVRHPVFRFTGLINCSDKGGDGVPRANSPVVEPECQGVTLANFAEVSRSRRGNLCSRDVYVDTITSNTQRSTRRGGLVMARLEEAKKSMARVHIILWERFDEGVWLLARNLGLQLGGYVRCQPKSDPLADDSATSLSDRIAKDKKAGRTTLLPRNLEQKVFSRIATEHPHDHRFYEWARNEYLKRHRDDLAEYRPGVCTMSGVQCWQPGLPATKLTAVEAERAKDSDAMMCAQQCMWPRER